MTGIPRPNCEGELLNPTLYLRFGLRKGNGVFGRGASVRAVCYQTRRRWLGALGASRGTAVLADGQKAGNVGIGARLDLVWRSRRRARHKARTKFQHAVLVEEADFCTIQRGDRLDRQRAKKWSTIPKFSTSSVQQRHCRRGLWSTPGRHRRCRAGFSWVQRRPGRRPRREIGIPCAVSATRVPSARDRMPSGGRIADHSRDGERGVVIVAQRSDNRRSKSRWHVRAYVRDRAPGWSDRVHTGI